MKIVHVVEPFASGIATFVRSLVEGLRDDTHFIVHGEREQVMRCRDVKLAFPKENVRFIRWRSAQRNIRIWQDIRAFFELYTILRRLKKKFSIDAVHLHSSKSGFLGRLACRLMKIRTVIYTPNGAPFLSGSPITCYLFKQLERLAAFFGGKVVCCSPSEWKAYHDLGIDAVHINNGVPIRTYRKQKMSEAAPGPKFPAGPKFNIVTCGRIVDQKNPALFNRIAGYFADFEDFGFIWIGDGPDRHLLTSPNITVTGWLSIRETQLGLSMGHVYISTSNFEGMPFAALEALVLQKPVLLKDCIGNRDIVLSGINGDLFSNADEAILKILRYHTNKEMLLIMGEFSQRYCEQEFDATTTSLSYRNLYLG